MLKGLKTRQALDKVLARLIAETGRDLEVPQDERGKKDLVRALMNVRPPKSLDADLARWQDAYLQEELAKKTLVSWQDLPTKDGRISLWQGDITCLQIDAIVNAANNEMLGCFLPLHSCIDNAIHSAAGIQLRLACEAAMADKRRIYGDNYLQPTGEPLLTAGYNLPAKQVIHVVGPIVAGALTPELEADLVACYRNVLDLCATEGIKTVAFPCISTGVFHFPNQRAAQLAVSTVRDWIDQHPNTMERIVFNVFKDEDKNYYEALL